MADHSILGRVPVEIWTDILDHAISSPVLPFQADGKLSPHLVDNLDLFVHRCFSFRRRHNIVLRLRSVCRTWYDILEGALKEYTLICDPRTWIRVPKQTRRLYIGGYPKCSCSPLYTRPGCISRLISIEGPGRMKRGPPITFNICSSNVKILMLDISHRSLFLALLFECPIIKALSMGDIYLEGFLHSRIFPYHVHYVTHLHLVLNRPNPLSQITCFSSVRYLSLDILSSHAVQNPYLGEWTFPSLQTLCILADMKQYTSPPRWLTDFLTVNGQNILELSIAHNGDPHYKRVGSLDDPYHFSASILDLFDLCKNVTTMGIPFDFHRWIQGGRVSTALYENKRRTVIVHGLIPEMKLSVYCVKGLIAIAYGFNAEKIIVSIGWDDLGIGARLHNTSVMSRLDELSNAFEGFSIPIVDQYFQSLQDFIAEQRILWARGKLKPYVMCGEKALLEN
ncbi:hypothetical protein CPB86DRAFT_792387 [Serendipita vermifera]|nr:hypothetical protein CPB86DRAFT_792387 [Serendipita vermifera]